jgi:hypothetical protein
MLKDQVNRNNQLARLKMEFERRQKRIVKKRLRDIMALKKEREELQKRLEELEMRSLNRRDETIPGSKDPTHVDYDPPSDSDSNLRSDGVAAVTQRAAGSKTQFQMLTRHTEAQFLWLAREMLHYIRTTTLDGKEYTEKAADDTKWIVSASQQLFITLVWARHNKAFSFWAFFFQLPARYVQKIVRRVTAAVRVGRATKSACRRRTRRRRC